MFQDWSDGKRFTKKSRSKTFVSIYFIFHFIYIVFFFFRFSFNILPLCDYTYIILVFFIFSGLARCDNKLRRQNLSVKNKINR